MKTLDSPNPLLYRLLKGARMLLKGRLRMTLVSAQGSDLYMGGTLPWGGGALTLGC